MDWKNKRVAVIGCARSGIAAAIKLKELGAIPFVSDTRTKDKVRDNFPDIEEFDGEFGGHTDKILENELIIVSPGVPLNIPMLSSAGEKHIPVWSELELGYQLAKDTSSKIIAVTGSNGKSTTASLIYHILHVSGVNTVLAGNIGMPFTSFPIEKGEYDYIVLEVSSFQLDTIAEFKPDIAVLLNITPDHLNRYHTFEAYRESKLRIFMNQTKNDYVILNFDDKECRLISDVGDARKILYSIEEKVNDCVWFNDDRIFIKDKENTLSIHCNDLPVRGLHNVSNAVASALVGLLSHVNSQKIIAALKSFTGLEHRLELVAAIDGKIFINDSKATNCMSVEKALASFEKPINLIMGGSDKNEDFSPLIPLVKKHVRNIIVLGETRNQIYETFKDATNIIKASDLNEAVYIAEMRALQDEYILLSPGCASYDMYNNFEERGRHFKEIVKEMKS